MRRTESRDALHWDLCVATFVWDAEEDGPIPVGTSYLRGAVPEGSIVIGGWIYAPSDIEGALAFYLGSQLLYQGIAYLLHGWTEFQPLLEYPPNNFGVEDEVSSRLRVESDAPWESGKFAVYVFYILDSSIPGVGGPTLPDVLDELLLDDMSFVEMDDGSSHILLSTT